MRKFAPGGRCGGSGDTPRGAEANPAMDSALSSLLAARSQQDSCWTQPSAEKLKASPPLTQTQTPTPQPQTLVVAQSVSKSTNGQKKIDIDCILGDF